MSTLSDNEILSQRIKSNVILKKAYNHVRLMSLSGAAGDDNGYYKHFNEIKSLQNEVDQTFIPRFKATSKVDKNKYPLILSENDFLQSYYVSSYEFSIFFDANLKIFNEYDFNDWIYNGTSDSMFENSIYRFFIGKYTFIMIFILLFI